MESGHILVTAPRSEPAAAVKLHNGYKRYTKDAVILRGTNMNVLHGTIYALLGPSGCGKTTLLSCIVGKQTLDSGSITMIFNKRKQVGYMPQEIALNSELTIEEQFNFYGRLNEMSYSHIKRRTAEMIEFLELPPKDKQIGLCSGGQQRRISMAATILHNPELIILDEPTVGVDPILCHKIWKVFLNLVNSQNKTIIITTHYIEEAKAAHTIGLMRGGILLAEEPPLDIMARFNCDTLEDAFLVLSRQQETSQYTAEYPPIKREKAPLSEDNTIINTRRLKAQLFKNLIWTYRNFPVTVFVCLVPLITMGIACTVDLRHMILSPIGLVATPLPNCTIPEKLNYSKFCLNISNVYCGFYEILSSRYPVIEFENEAQAIYAGKRGHVIALVYFAKNFSAGVMERLEKQMSSSKTSIEDGTLYVSSDMSNFASAYRIRLEIYEAFQDLLKNLCRQCDIHESFAKIPIEFRDAIYGGEATDVTSLFPGLLNPFVFYMSFVYMSTALTMERESGLLERYQISGLTIVEVLLAQSMIQLVILNVQTTLLFLVIYGIYDNLMMGSMLNAYFILIFSEIFGMAYGIFLGLAMNEEILLIYAGIGSMLASFALCGCFWPIEGQHGLLKLGGKFFPLTYSAQSYFHISTKGWGLNHLPVFSGFFATGFGSFFLLGLTVLFYKIGLIQV